VACVNIPRIIYIGNTSPRLQAHLAPSCDYKEGSGCAFFLCHKAQRCSSLPSLHRVQLFSDDVSGLLHHLEIGPAYLGHLQAILDQVPAGPCDHPGRYGGIHCQIGSGYASSRLLAQAMRTLLARGTLGLWQVVRRGPALETRGNVCAAPA
jgi:hypothetical protein